MLQFEIETAIRLARLAGKTILQHYEDGVETEEKLGADDHFEPVTVADRDASRIIVDGIMSEFPDDAVLSEEEVDDPALRLSNRRVWIIDPIDGTSGFVKHDGDFGVQIGLAEDGVPVAGVVYLPFHDALSYAVRGGGSYIVTDGGDPVRASVSEVTEFTSMGLAVSRNHLSGKMHQIIKHFGFTRIVNRGSVGLKVGLIADRTCDIYIHPSPRTKLWDTCAPQIILEEAGGRFTDLFGMELRYDKADLQNRNGILAATAAAHPLAVKHLRPLLDEFGRTPHPAKAANSTAR